MFYFTRNLRIGLVLGLLVGSSGAQAEPLYPLLSTGAVDSLRTLFTQSREDTNQVEWLLRLGEDFINKKEWPPDDEVTEMEVISARAECYLALGQYPRAEKHYRRMLGVERNLQENVTRKVNTYQRVGNFYLIKKRYDNARRSLDTALLLNAQGGTLKAAMSIHLLLFKLDSAQGHYKEAIAHHQRYKALNDSIFNEIKSKQTASLLVRYQMKEKEHNIALLTKQNQVQGTL